MSHKIKKRNTKTVLQFFKKEVEMLTLDVYKSIDKETEAELTRLRTEESVVPSCRKGCFSCCRQPIDVPLPEAYTIAQYIRNNFSHKEVESLNDRLDKWLLWVKEELPHYEQKGIDAYAAFYNHGVFCPLLVNGSCSIYAVRPVVCRGYYVSSDPRSCLPLNDEAALKEEPVPLGSIPVVGSKHAMRIRALVEMRGLNFDDSVLLLPQWLIVELRQKP